ncbi:MAG: BamA/TamA family outer membrane protein [Pseudomonadota bacterium]
MASRCGGLLALSLLAGCGLFGERDEAPTDPFADTPGIPYETLVNGAPNDTLKALVEDSLKLNTLADRPPASLARLRRRAETDLETAAKILRSEGYYEGQTSLAIDPPAAAGEGDKEPPPARVTITLEPGRQFSVSEFTFTPQTTAAGTDVPPPSDFGVAANMPARAADIVAVEGALVDWLKDNGYPYATFVERQALADLDADTLSVASQFDPGPLVTVSDVNVEGLNTVEQTYVDTYLKNTTERQFAQSDLRALQRRLAQTSLFEYVTVEPASEGSVSVVNHTARVPVAITVEEGPHRSVGGGLRFSTEDGPTAGAFFEHRNLFGANETTRIGASIGLNKQEVTAGIRKPQFLRDRQALYGNVRFLHEEDEAFDETSFRITTGIERVVTEHLTLNVGGLFEVAKIEGSETSGTSYLFGLPLSAIYDRTDDRFDPTRGLRLRAGITPYVGAFDDNDLLFNVVDVGGSTYVAIDDGKRYVFATRARIASLIGAARDTVPPPQRLYSGGGGSVRGYENRFIGPLDDDEDPVGGRSAAELGLELRVRITESIGLVPFVEAGVVSREVLPNTDDGIQYAAGLGLRYYTAIGPIRADIAFPLNPRDEDDFFQFYVAIGQAF